MEKAGKLEEKYLKFPKNAAEKIKKKEINHQILPVNDGNNRFVPQKTKIFKLFLDNTI